MCGRYVLKEALFAITERFAVAQTALNVAPNYNVSPTQQLPVILEDEGQRQLVLMQWGLVPPWANKPGAHAQKPLINARTEGIETKASFRRAIKTQRVCVPASGYYEWMPVSTGKQPYFIHRRDGALVAFAGLYEHARDEAGDEHRTFTIITCPASEVTAPIHDRMPVILQSPDDEEEWLDPTVTDPQQVVRFLRPYPSDLLETYPVSRKVNAVINNGPELIAKSA